MSVTRSPQSFKHKSVRDLAWTIQSPPLMRNITTDCEWPDDIWFKSLYEDYVPTLELLDEHSEELNHCIAKQKDKRLGSYFETLWDFWLKTNSRYEVAAKNLQIREDKNTLGELDFIVHDKQTNQYLHWEVAVKFYLGLGDTSKHHNWYGPGLIDRLDIKLKRLIEHQIAMSSHPHGINTLNELDFRIDGRAIILKGRLFYPHKNAAPPTHANPGHLSGWWLHLDDFIISNADHSRQWIVLSKFDWLSEIGVIDSTKILTTAELCIFLNESAPDQVHCIVALDNNKEINRGFIVPNAWGPIS